MSLIITKECIHCGACDDVCPAKAITEDKDTGLRFINPNRCTECVGFYEMSMCIAECPVECIIKHPDYQEDEPTLLARANSLKAPIEQAR